MSTPFDHIPSCSRTADYTKPTATASRVAQVEAELQSRRQCNRFISADERDDLARALAAEVDARDDVIAEILAMLKPPIIAHGPNDEWGAYCESCWWSGSARDAKWTGIDSEYDGSCPICGKGIEEYTGDERTAAIYARACEIAGRTE